SEFVEHSFGLMNLKEDLEGSNKSYSKYEKVSKEDLKFDDEYEDLINAESNNS
ncbi:2727_t:CDS:2, partial [Funneliformis mosseae]